MDKRGAIKKGDRIKIKFYDRTLWSRYLTVLGVISSVVTLVSFFVTATDIGINILYLIVPFVCTIIAIFLVMWYCANHTNHADLKINNTTVRILEGDIWKQFAKKPEERTKEIYLLTYRWNNTCFIGSLFSGLEKPEVENNRICRFC